MTKREKQKIRRTAVLVTACGVIAAAVLAMVVTIVGFVYHRYFAKDTMVEYDRISMSKPDITEALLTPNKNSRPRKPLKRVRGIVIHYTANPGTDAMANRNYFESRKDKKDALKNKVSSHFIVGLDGEIVQCIPLEEIAYASNERNKDTISIECCHPDASGKFNRKTYQALIQLCAWLCAEYRVAGKEEIIRHYDITGKMCPLYYVENEQEWEKLRLEIWNMLVEAQYQ